jgi:hypothetical protein
MSDHTVAADDTPRSPAAADALSHQGSGNYWISAALLALVLVGLFAAMDHRYVGLPDEGVYAAQAQNLLNGGWDAEREGATVDPLGYLDPLAPDAVLDSRSIPYYRHPLYPVVLSAVYPVGAYGAMVAISLVGTWIAAVAAGRISARLNPAAPIATCWLVGIGSPLLFSGFTVIAHAPGAAASSLLALFTLRATEGKRSAWFWAVAAAAVLVLLRSEGVLVVCALAVGLGVVGLRRHGLRGVVHSKPFWLAIVVVAAAASAYLAERYWVGAISPSSGDIVPDSVRREDNSPLSGLWISLLRPWHDQRSISVAAVLVPVTTVGAAVALRFRPQRPLLGLSLMAMSAVSALLVLAGPPDLIAGLFVVFPAAAFGLLWLSRETMRSDAALLLATTCLVASVGLAFTIYGDGGATQWGGRFFHVLIPLIAPLAMSGIATCVNALAAKPARLVGACLAATSLLLGAAALRTIVDARSRMEDVVTTVTGVVSAEDERGNRTLAVVAQTGPDGTSRGFWQERDTLEVVRLNTIDELAPIINSAAEAGYRRVAVLTGLDAALAGLVAAPALSNQGWEILTDTAAGDGGYRVLLLGPSL